MHADETNYDLTGKRIAILVADGFEQDELLKPREALEDAGAETKVVSPCEGKVKSHKHHRPGRSVTRRRGGDCAVCAHVSALRSKAFSPRPPPMAVRNARRQGPTLDLPG